MTYSLLKCESAQNNCNLVIIDRTIVNIQEDKGITIEALRELIREEIKKELQNLNKR